jgi:hypothetical protein
MADLLYQAVLEKITGEQFDEEFEFDGFIPESTNVNSRTVSATKVDGTDATSAVVISSSYSGTVVTVTLNTGSTETAYIIKVAVVATDATPSVMVKLLNVTSPGVYR